MAYSVQRFTRLVAESRTRHQLLDIVVHEVCAALVAEACSVFLKADATDVFLLAATAGYAHRLSQLGGYGADGGIEWLGG